MGRLCPSADNGEEFGTGVERGTTTNDAGYYQMPFLPLGQYQVTAWRTGFTMVIAEQVDVTLNKTTTANLSLRTSAVKESVTVMDVAPLIDLTSGQIRQLENFGPNLSGWPSSACLILVSVGSVKPRLLRALSPRVLRHG
jgi:hypothetical protein